MLNSLASAESVKLFFTLNFFRIDIQKYVQPINFMDMVNCKKGTSSKELKERVEKARQIQQNRFKDIKSVNCNSQMVTSHIKEFCTLDTESMNIMKKAFDKYNFSARSYHKFLRVARTFADMDESKNIRKNHIIRALMCRDLDKEELLSEKIFSTNVIDIIINSKSVENAKNIIDICNKKNIKILTMDNDLYPNEVKFHQKSPISLYYRGNIMKNSMGIGIVGSRRCSNYGKKVAAEAAEFLAEHNIPVISGMAKGIDGLVFNYPFIIFFSYHPIICI